MRRVNLYSPDLTGDIDQKWMPRMCIAIKLDEVAENDERSKINYNNRQQTATKRETTATII